MTTILENAQGMLRGELPPPPVGRLLGFVLKSIEPGHAIFEMEADERRHNPMGTLHGDIYCDLADAAMGYADRMKRTVAMERPLLLGVVGFRYPEPLRYQEHDLEQELDLVAVTRRQMARTLRLVAPDAWQRAAVHSETGLVTLRQLLLHAINHLRHHLRFVAEKRNLISGVLPALPVISESGSA